MTQMSEELEISVTAAEMTRVLSHLEDIQLTKRKSVSFEDALEETGFGKFNIFLILVCGLIMFSSTSDSYSVGYIIPVAECELKLDSYTKGILSSTNLIGTMSSCAIWGYLSDYKGRKNLLLINLILQFIAGFLSVFISSFWGFCVLRILNGICLACPAAIIFVYFGEFLHSSTKAKCMSWGGIFIALGLTFLPVLGWPLLQSQFKIEFFGIHINNWRIYMLINSAPSLLAALLLLKLPESPKYLYQCGKFDETLKILRNMYSRNLGKPEYTFPVISLDEKIVLESNTSKSSIFKGLKQQLVPLFRPPLLNYTFLVSFLQAGAFAVCAGIYVWYPDVIKQISNSGKTGITVCEALSANRNPEDSHPKCNNTVNHSVFILNIIIGVVYLIGYAMWGISVKLFGTKIFYMINLGLSAVSTAALCFLSQRLLIDILFVISLTLSGISVTILNSWVVDIFPTKICGVALCICLTVGRLGSVISSSVFGILVEWNCVTTFLLYALNLLICVSLSLILPRKS